jgi:hypothetical protein
LLQREQHYKNNPPRSIEEIRAITQQGKVLHESHYIMFWAIDEIALSLSERARRVSSYSTSTASLLASSTATDSVLASGLSVPTGDLSIPVVGQVEVVRLSFQQALEAMTETVRLLEIMLPPVHHEKVVYYDRLGQLAVAAGNAELAASSFQTAYEMSRLACSEVAPTTVKLQKLATNTPKTVEELVEHYTVEDDADGDDWSDVDVEVEDEAL